VLSYRLPRQFSYVVFRVVPTAEILIFAQYNLLALTVRVAANVLYET
jgi:hypothetical protein